MLAKPFNHTHAKCLLKATGTNNYWVIDDQGVWPKKSEPDFEPYFQPTAETRVGPGIDKEFDSWVPVNVFARDEDAPDCANTPALSFPFDARDLAAFMLYGNGCLIAEYYGGWENGPDSERLDALLPDNFSRRAVKEAFEAYREAKRIVGPYPLELDAKADRARKAWNDADSETNKETKDALDLEMEATAAEAKAAQGKWLEAMVRVLLKPSQEQTAATPAPVVVATGEPAKPAARVDKGLVLKKAALIDKYERRWPTIKRDFKDASENALSRAAKSPGHGNWFEEEALNWARQRGKLSE